MTRTRSILAAALSLAAAALLGGCAATSHSCAPATLAYVGSDLGRLQALRVDSCRGTLTSIGVVVEVPKPRWGGADAKRGILYVASDAEGTPGQVVALAADRDTGALRRTGSVSSGGAGTTQLRLDPASMTLLTADFGSGSASSIALEPDGRLGSLVSTVKSVGSGPHRRQAAPHAHGVAVDPTGRFVLVPDLGADRVFVYRFDRATHALLAYDPAEPRAFAVPPGSGPHHIVFGADGRFAYLLNELTADVTTLRWDSQRGRLTQIDTLPISSATFNGTKSGSEIAVGADGRFVYVADRGENTLVVYRADPESGLLSFVQRTPAGGTAPWTFAIDAHGSWMLVANQRSDRVNLFRIDPLSGLLSDMHQSAPVPTPLSITLMD